MADLGIAFVLVSSMSAIFLRETKELREMNVQEGMQAKLQAPISMMDFVLRRDGDSTKPVVLLVNAIGIDARIWQPLRAALLRHFSVASLQRAWTECEELEQGDYRCRTSDLQAIASACAQLQPVAAIAWCSGAQALLEYVANERHELRRLVLCGPGLHYLDAARQSTLEQNYSAIMRRIDANPSLAKILCKSLGQASTGPRSREVSAVLEPILRRPFEDPKRLVRYARDYVAFRNSLELDLASIAVPTLVVGGHEDQVVLPQNFPRIAEQLPFGELLEGDFDHHALYTDSDVIARCARFLAA